MHVHTPTLTHTHACLYPHPHTHTPTHSQLMELLQRQPGRGLELSLWIRTILTTHTAYLMTVSHTLSLLFTACTPSHHTHPHTCARCLTYTTHTLTHVHVPHTTHTLTHLQVPQLVNSFSGLYQLLDARVGTFSRLSRLQGKLDLMLTQAAAAGGTDTDHAHLTTPLLTVTVGGEQFAL